MKLKFDTFIYIFDINFKNPSFIVKLFKISIAIGKEVG